MVREKKVDKFFGLVIYFSDLGGQIQTKKHA